jgi:hypothetical protein
MKLTPGQKTDHKPAFEPMEEGESTLMLYFQDRSLREHIWGAKAHEDGLRTPAFSAHLDIFLTAVQVLMSVAEPRLEGKYSGLIDYAVFSWMKHFISLDFEDTAESSANEEQVMQVVEGLSRVISNAEVVSRRIYDSSDAYYDDFL